MTQDICEFVNDSCDLLGFGEPDHREPAYGLIRNELFARLVERGFRSIALETDRVAAFAVDDYVREGEGDFEAVLAEGFSHGFGAHDANRRLVAWMREYNERRAPEERLAFHGMDAPFEFTAESPRRYLEFGRDRLGLDLDLAPLVGDDDRWGGMEAVTDPDRSPGDTDEARRLRAIADDMLTALYAEAPRLIAAASRADWDRARVHVATALDLLRYHRQAAVRTDEGDRWSRLSAVRDAIMARNLLDVRDLEARRGPTMVCGHNVHLQRNRSRMSMAGMDLAWNGAGAVVAALLRERYVCVLGGTAPGAGEAWGLTAADEFKGEGRFPLDRETLEGADAVLHLNESAT
ncbi:erythromycin esterase family protein [Glycomyces sp. A-F 0318]|uniref:erythromycin esterase family protein n=1 Tax=Glycomyces amatae TaxID=2881355 RepID=UPI001E2C1D5B|nr:erythromycin esterase family protein [Glycomyces amatae]MCD0444963.1 erythromycin esterase family protein [Glycomyces amatae]